MAKTKDKTKTRPKLPKRVGGVKLSKEIRKAGGKLLEKANSPLGRELIATGLGMAAAAAAGAAERQRGKREPAKTPADAGPALSQGIAKGPSRGAPNDPHEIGVVLGTIAKAALAGLFAPKKG